MKIPQSTLRHLLASAIAWAAAGQSPAAVTYVDPSDILIPFTFEGVYLDIETEAENGSTAGAVVAADSYTISFSEPASGDWDVNFFFGGGLITHNTTFQPYRSDAGNNLSAIHKIGLNTAIDGTPVDPEPATGPSIPLASATFGGSGTTTGGGLDGSQMPTHMGPAANQFASGSKSDGYIAFVLNPGPDELYGWIHVSLSDDGTTGLIHDWAYSDSAIMVGQVPEPGSLALLLAGATLLFRRSRRPID